jgi:uncharacterized protein (TIGR00290 family)
MTGNEVVALSWSGGKDSAIALKVLREDPSLRVAYLLTTITDEYERVSIHGVRRTLLERQAEAVGISLVEVVIPARCTNEIYQASMVAALTSVPLAEIDTHAFADLFLEDVRSYRETNLAKLGKTPIFPIWGRDTTRLAHEFTDLGFRAKIVCVDTRILDPNFAGREFDLALLRDLPQGVDPCGENGEFHTFVYDGPGFSSSIAFNVGETVIREGLAYKDLVEA